MINKLLCFMRGHKYVVDTRLTALRNLLELNIFDKYQVRYRDWETDRKSTRLNSSHITRSRMPSSA